MTFDKFKEAQVSKLHQELQSYKADLLAKAVQPFVMGIIMIHDDIQKAIEEIGKSSDVEINCEKIIKFIKSFREDIEILLAQNGVTIYYEADEMFNGHRQRVMRKIPTDDDNLIGKVAHSLRTGFERSSVIVQKEAVAVYVKEN